MVSRPCIFVSVVPNEDQNSGVPLFFLVTMVLIIQVSAYFEFHGEAKDFTRDSIKITTHTIVNRMPYLPRRALFGLLSFIITLQINKKGAIY